MVGARLCWPLTEPQDTSRNIFDWRQSSWWQQMTVPSGLTIKITNKLSVTKRKRTNKFNLVPFFPKRCCWRQSLYPCYWQTCHTFGLPILSLSVGGHTRFWHGQVGQCNVATVPAEKYFYNTSTPDVSPFSTFYAHLLAVDWRVGDLLPGMNVWWHRRRLK